MPFTLTRGTSPTTDRPAVRSLTAALAAAALIYALIGFQVVAVIQPVSDQTGFGLLAAGAFALGASLLLTVKRRLVWLLGALFQLVVIALYVNVASARTPSYEVWAITLRLIQVLLLIGLVYLTVRSPREQPDRPPVARRPTTAAT